MWLFCSAKRAQRGSLVIFSEKGAVYRAYIHPEALFGCSWCPTHKDVIATGCKVTFLLSHIYLAFVGPAKRLNSDSCQSSPVDLLTSRLVYPGLNQASRNSTDCKIVLAAHADLGYAFAWRTPGIWFAVLSWGRRGEQ